MPRLLQFQWSLTDAEQRWSALSAAHIAGQHDFSLHWRTHTAMLQWAWQQRDAREVAGQLMRLALTPLGHVFNRLPAGNPGRATVSAFMPMQVPAHLQQLMDAAAHNTLPSTDAHR